MKSLLTHFAFTRHIRFSKTLKTLFKHLEVNIHLRSNIHLLNGRRKVRSVETFTTVKLQTCLRFQRLLRGFSTKDCLTQSYKSNFRRFSFFCDQLIRITIRKFHIACEYIRQNANHRQFTA